jgi:hypothetical protein
MVQREQFGTDRAIQHNKIRLVQVSSCSDTGSIRDDSYWTSKLNSLENDPI